MKSQDYRGFLVFGYLRRHKHRIRKHLVGILEEILAYFHAIVDRIAAGASGLTGCFAYRRACYS